MSDLEQEIALGLLVTKVLKRRKTLRQTSSTGSGVVVTGAWVGKTYRIEISKESTNGQES